MAKPALGRGLGDLMQGTKVAGSPADPPSDAAGAGETNLAPGLTSFLRGAKPAETVPEESAAIPKEVFPPRPRPTQLIQVSLIGADLLLSGLAAVMVFKRTAPLSPGEGWLCFAAVALGAWLSCLAVMLDSPSE